MQANYDCMLNVYSGKIIAVLIRAAGIASKRSLILMPTGSSGSLSCWINGNFTLFPIFLKCIGIKMRCDPLMILLTKFYCKHHALQKARSHTPLLFLKVFPPLLMLWILLL